MSAFGDAGANLRRLVWSEPATLVLGLAIFALLVIFVLLPIVEVITFPPFGDYLDLPQNGRWVRAALNTCRMVVLSTTSATVLGFLYAFVISRPDLPLRGPLRLIATLPLFSPPFTLGFSYLLMYGRFGLISHDVFGFETSILGWKSLWAVQTLTHFPYAALAIERALVASPARLEAAARNLGAGGFTVFRTITLPLVRPAVAGAALLIAIYVLADFANPLVIGGDFPLLATEAWYRIDGWGDMRGATLLAATLLPPAFLLFVAERFFVGRRRYTVISGRGGALERTPVPRSWPSRFLGLCLFVAAIILSLYFGIIAGALHRNVGGRLDDHFRQMADRSLEGRSSSPQPDLRRGRGVAATVFSTVAAFLVNQRAIPARRAIDLLCVLPAAVPGVFVGIGYLLAFNRPGMPIAGTATLMVLAFTFANLPVQLSGGEGRSRSDRSAPRRCRRRSRRFPAAGSLGRAPPASPAGLHRGLDRHVRQLHHQSEHRHIPGHRRHAGRDLLHSRPDRRQPPRSRLGADHGAPRHHACGRGGDLADIALVACRARGVRCLTPMSNSSGCIRASPIWRPSPT